MAKITKNQQLFIDIILQLQEDLYDESYEQANNIYKEQKKNRDTLLGEIASITLLYKVSEDTLMMDLSNKNKALLQRKLDKIIADNRLAEISLEKEITNTVLRNTVLNKYGINDYVLDMGLDFKLTKLEPKVIDKIIRNKVDGVVWSDRLYTNKTEIAKALHKEMSDFLNGKTNINKIADVIKDRYNVNANVSKRLVRNETSRVMSEVNEQWCKDRDIEYQMFCATLDDVTTDICQSLDGNVYSYDDTNKPIPPDSTHINCRSTLIAIPSKNWRPSTRLDNNTKRKITYKTYTEWAEK